MKKVFYLTLDVILAIHDDMIERYGGSFGIRDVGLIQSAIARPQTSFGGEDLCPSIIDKAAALFHSLIFNHAFVDGNKRTAMTATARFLYINGYELAVDEKEFVDFPLRVEKKRLNIEEITKWLLLHANKQSPRSKK